MLFIPENETFSAPTAAGALAPNQHSLITGKKERDNFQVYIFTFFVFQEKKASEPIPSQVFTVREKIFH